MFSKCLCRTWMLRGGVAVTAARFSTLHDKKLHAEEVPASRDENWKWFSDPVTKTGLKAPRWPGPAMIPEEPSFTRAQVAVHDGSSSAGTMWVTYRDGVYDVTDYVAEHPGGKFILNAAGGPVDSWWAYWMHHHNSKTVAATLERLRIGHLSDWIAEDDEEARGGGRWEEEQLLLSRAENRESTERIAEMPYQSVTKCAALAQAYLTPGSVLFVRNHAPIPPVSSEEAHEHIVSFCVHDVEVASCTLQELQEQFKNVTVTSVLQCTGNRAADNIANNGSEKSGFSGSEAAYIGLGMLGNVSWDGVRLSDVLRKVIPVEHQASWRELDDLLVTFEGLDGFYSSTPLQHVMCSQNDCLLATHMNGEALLPDHGFPMRVVLPGCPGARQVKWISKVSIGFENNSPWNRHYYKHRTSGEAMQTLPMNSVILSPEPGAFVDAAETTLSVFGIAYNGGTDHAIARVEISSDRGQTWHTANCRFNEIPVDDSSRPRGWVRFEATLKLPRALDIGCGGPLGEIWCRAFDDAGQVQPQRSEAHGGYLYNGYHKVPIVRTHPLRIET